MENCHPVPKPGSQQPQQLRRQRDLRYQQHGAFPGVQALLDKPDVNRRLSGAGDAVEQGHTGISGFHLFPQALKTPLLGFIQNQGAGNIGRFDLPAPENRPFREDHIALFLQGL